MHPFLVSELNSQMTRDDLIAQIISEEVSGLADSTFANSETIKGTLSVVRSGDQLEPPDSVEAIETDAEDLADALVAPEEFVPGDPELLMKLESISGVLVQRLGPRYRSEMFRATHSAKMRIKELRQTKHVELSSLRHAIVGEYIDALNEHLSEISNVEKEIVEELQMASLEPGAKAPRIIEAVVDNIKFMRGKAEEDGTAEAFDEHVTIPTLGYLSDCENRTRFAL